jgi:cbb3-type cytochrome oxidase cytochrome c subunit
MKNGFWVFCAALIALGGSWCGFVLAPELQLGGAKQTTVLNSSDVYPIELSGDATLGLQVYRADGCAACHTEQVRQTGTACSVMLTDAGKNPEAITNLISSLVLTNLTKEDADAAAAKIAAAGGKTEIHLTATGPDIARGWGMRRSVAEDYLYDQPVQLGSLRAGPDLSNAGARADSSWQLLHLYAPKSVVKGSTMPPFRYLFEVRKIGREPSPDALKLPPEFAPPAGYEVVPKSEAKQLAAYLSSLRASVPLYSAPISP